MTEPDPAKPSPLSCAPDHAFTAELLTIVVSALNGELHMLRQSYDFLYGELSCTQNLLKAVMTAHGLGSTNEAWRVERHIQQDLD